MPDHLQKRLDEHRERGERLVGQIVRDYDEETLYRGSISEAPSAAPLKKDGELALSVLVAAVVSPDSKPWGREDELDFTDSPPSIYVLDLQTWLARRALPYTIDDVKLLTVLAEPRHRGPDWEDLGRCRVAVAALERYAKDRGIGDVSDALDQLHRYVGRRTSSADWTSLGVRLRKLAPVATDLDRSILAAKDPWTKKVRPVVEQRFAAQGALLNHLGSATASRPTKKWLDQAQTLMGGEGHSLVRYLLEATFDVESDEIGRQVWEGRTYVEMLWLSDPSATVVRGCLWASTLVEDDDWLVPVAGAIVERGMREEELKVTNAALYALGERRATRRSRSSRASLPA